MSRTSGIWPNISCVKSRTCLFVQPLAFANEKIADSCFAVSRPGFDTLESKLSELVRTAVMSISLVAHNLGRVEVQMEADS